MYGVTLVYVCGNEIWHKDESSKLYIKYYELAEKVGEG